MPICSTSFSKLRQWGSNEVVRSLVRTHSAGQAGIGYKRAADVARPAHLGALIAAKQRILDMIRGATSAGVLPAQPLLVLLVATAAFVDALDNSEKPMARLYQQEAAQAANDS